GSYSFEAIYSGDGNYNASTSAVEPLTISKANTTTSTTINDSSTSTTPTGLGDAAFDTAPATDTHFPTNRTGTHQLFTNSSATGTASTSPVGHLSPRPLPSFPTRRSSDLGSYSFEAIYSGDGNYNASTSAVEPLTISKANTTTSTTIKDASTNGTPTGQAGES